LEGADTASHLDLCGKNAEVIYMLYRFNRVLI
jgi:hypothetical protein